MKLDFCVACGERDSGRLEHHHLVPRVAGGSDDETNLITLCHGCHGRAHGYDRQNVRALSRVGLAAAKARGVKLGADRGNLGEVRAKGIANSVVVRQAASTSRASDLLPVLTEIQAAGAQSLREIATALDARGIRTARGGLWSAVQVKRVLDRIGLAT